MTYQNLQEFITLKEAADELRLSVSTLKRYIYAGQLQTYRTPGGSHRVRRSDLAALLGAAPSPQPTALAVVPKTENLAEEVAERVSKTIHHRLQFLESELERLECSLDVIANAVRHAVSSHTATHTESIPGGCEIKVLGPGCRACDQLARLVINVAQALGVDTDAVHRIRELDEIAEYGPTPMPALVVNNQLISAGRLPSKSRLRDLLKRCLPNQTRSIS